MSCVLVSPHRKVQRWVIELSLINGEFRERLNGSQCLIFNVLDLFSLVLGPFPSLCYWDWVEQQSNAPTFASTGCTLLLPGAFSLTVPGELRRLDIYHSVSFSCYITVPVHLWITSFHFPSCPINAIWKHVIIGLWKQLESGHYLNNPLNLIFQILLPKRKRRVCLLVGNTASVRGRGGFGGAHWWLQLKRFAVGTVVLRVSLCVPLPPWYL